MLLFLIASDEEVSQAPSASNWGIQRHRTIKHTAVPRTQQPFKTSTAVKDGNIEELRKEIHRLHEQLEELTFITNQKIAIIEQQLFDQFTQNRQAFVSQGGKGLISLAAFLKALSQPDISGNATTFPRVDFKEQILFYDPKTSQVLALDRDSTPLFESYDFIKLFNFSNSTETTITQIQDFFALLILMANETKYRIKPSTEKRKYDAQGRYMPDFIVLEKLIQYMMKPTQPQSSQAKPSTVNINDVRIWKEYFESITFK